MEKSIKDGIVNVENIDGLIEWWLEYKFQPNDYETEEQFNKRKEMVLPILIEEKQRRNETHS